MGQSEASGGVYIYKYIKSKALPEKIVGRMSLQSTPTYQVAYDWLQRFFRALQGGVIPRFISETSIGAAQSHLVQVASRKSPKLAQISFTSAPETTSTAEANKSEHEVEYERPAPV
ncbi:hypothetical protein DVH05_025816 [Phytophthora capsici]|nr:hypothetical protein DVH05_025816 [Phytophthora capsici]